MSPVVEAPHSLPRVSFHNLVPKMALEISCYKFDMTKLKCSYELRLGKNSDEFNETTTFFNSFSINDRFPHFYENEAKNDVTESIVTAF